MKKCLLLLLLLSTSWAQAELYKSVDENGEVVYSDKPHTLGAKEFVPPALLIQPPIKIPPKKIKPIEEKSIPYPYSDLHFSKPGADENFHGDEGNISYVLETTPVLAIKLGHYLNIKFDGAVQATKTTSLSGVLNNVDRGSHNISAEICDAKGQVLRSTNVSFHVHKVIVPKPVAP